MQSSPLPYQAGRLVNQIKKLAEDVCRLPRLKRSPDPDANYLLALAEAGKAHYLVTGDKTGFVALARRKSAQIMTAHDFAALFAADAPQLPRAQHTAELRYLAL